MTLGIASFSFAVLLLALFVYARRSSRTRGNAVLLLGASDAGKTAILTTLAYHQTIPTHTSIQINATVIALPESKRSLRLVDVPGHPRIRDQFREYLPEAKALMFVVDASTISRNGTAVAEHLHHVLHALSSLPPTQTPPALLILAHKYDALKTGASTASGANTPDQLAINRVRSILERELEKRRATHAGSVGMESLGGDGEEGGELGGLDCAGGGGVFRFADWDGGEVEFLGTSVAYPSEKGEATDEMTPSDARGLSSLRQWLDSVS
ncbi:P-loop containing nucleoside triphosphate hydrolase protein [Punctularia strigosozonata HHB-11173 SS5]|uniref:P-loop containing nucleoside triphosphate hydrolase protein n=1 Tax=Punctularia strigosozonata (strain HHB-11173) TaxID=741275 RepID=UPI00044186BD|nr:P-loop containing nucleoside triphosphate hydrolase protein [Punctularia strigosozonata HHB-11173 SS5]EIN07239.1 P-loop containing nucleoside triphosphate hydrolase protein [Punctularia strigosozonata HHB-11173 SS5]